jgi:SPASM domain peptide maturase of grasp-with-spasm system
LLKDKNYEDFIGNLTIENKLTISEYVDFLLENEIGFFLTNRFSGKFLNISDTYQVPYEISNLSLEINSNSLVVIENLSSALVSQKIQCIEIVCFNEILTPNVVFKIIDGLSSIFFDELRIILKYSPEYSLEYAKKICRGNIEIHSILFHSSVFELNEILEDGLTKISYQKKEISNCLACGKVSTEYFTANSNFFFEGLSRNTCLNKKIAIDKFGNVKNCLSQSNSYGNIFSHNILSIYNSINFQNLWFITKDKINKCNICEFRMICPDCRVFIENPEDILSAPLKCGFDPYTGVWSDWEKDVEKADTFRGFKLKAELH